MIPRAPLGAGPGAPQIQWGPGHPGVQGPGPLGLSGALFRIVLGHLGTILGHLGPISGHLGAISGHPGAILKDLGATLGHLGAILTQFWPKSSKILFPQFFCKDFLSCGRPVNH